VHADYQGNAFVGKDVRSQIGRDDSRRRHTRWRLAAERMLRGIMRELQGEDRYGRIRP
jgi:hypothetical protein